MAIAWARSCWASRSISSAGYRSWPRGSGPQAVTDRQLVADEACRDAEEADERTDDRDNPRVRSDTGLIARANSEEDDNPLPQAEPVAITPTPTDLLERFQL